MIFYSSYLYNNLKINNIQLKCNSLKFDKFLKFSLNNIIPLSLICISNNTI